MKYTKEFKLECIRKRKAKEYIETPPGFRMNIFVKWYLNTGGNSG